MPRPISPRITREAAIQAALDAIDQTGLDTFTLAAVAQQLGVAAPSLYHHFDDRSEILAEVARLILTQGEEQARDVQEQGWAEALLGLSLSVRRSILRHPKAAPLLLLYPPRHLALRGYERWLRLLQEWGVPKALHITLISGLDAIVFGSALLLSSTRAAGLQLFPQFDSVEFPALANALEANRLADEETFIRVLRAFLEGIYPTNGTERAREALGRAVIT